MTRAELGGFRVAHAAWLFGLIAFFMPPATWNPVSRFALTRAIVEERSIQIDAFATSTGDRAFFRGHWYSDKPPVPAFAAAPVYALVRVAQRARGVAVNYESLGNELHPAVSVYPNKEFQQALYACSLATSGVAGIAIGLLLFELLRRRTTSLVAFWSSTVVFLGTPLFPYSTSFYSHVPSAALLLAAVVLLDRHGQRPVGRSPSNRALRAAGLCLVLAPGCEYLAAGPAALIAAWFLLKSPPAHRLSAGMNLAVGGLGPLAGLAIYHAAAFGAPWRTGYSFETKPEFVVGHAQGLVGIRLPTFAGVWGLSMGNRRGLFYLSPIAVIGVIFGIAHVKRRRDWAFAVGLVALGVLFTLNAGYYMWWGGAAAGPRHLIPGLPFLAAGVMLGLRARQVWVRALTALTGVVSVLNFTLLTAVGIEGPAHRDLLYAYAWPRVRAERLATYAGGSNLGLKLGLYGSASLLPLFLWGSGGAAYLVWQILASRRRFFDARLTPRATTTTR